MGSFHPPTTPQHPAVDPHAQMRYLTHSAPRPAVSGMYPGTEMQSPRGLEAQKAAQHMVSAGLVRYAHVPSSDVQANHMSTVRSSAHHHLAPSVGSLAGKEQHQPTVYSSLSQPNQLVNPVEQTLALLGIPTPVRRSESGVSLGPSATMSDLSMDQIRRRLALRETSVVSAAQTMLFPGGATATLGGTTAMSGSSIAAAAVRPGTVLGVHEVPSHQQAPRFFAPAPFPVGVGPAANGIIASVPRPTNYPGPAATTALGQGAKCS